MQFVIKPLVCGHAVVLCENASGQPREEESADESPVTSQHGCNQQDGSSTQRRKEQRPVV